LNAPSYANKLETEMIPFIALN